MGTPENEVTEADGNGSERGPRSETSAPNAPLGKSIDFAKAVIRSGGTGDVPAADVMRELGITVRTTRGWAFTLPAAVQFGLVERIGRGDDLRIRVTDLGKRITKPVTPDEARAAKMAAVRSPPVYKDLLARFADCPVPAKEGLVNLLHRDFGILESTAPNVADCFLESIKDADLVTADSHVAPDGATSASRGGAKEDDKPNKPPDRAMLKIEVPASYVLYPFLMRQGMSPVIIPLPADMKMKDVKRLSRFLEGAILDEDEPAPT